MKLYFCNYPGDMILVTNHVPTVAIMRGNNGAPVATFTYREPVGDEISALYRHCFVTSHQMPQIPENKIITLEVN